MNITDIPTSHFPTLIDLARTIEARMVYKLGNVHTLDDFGKSYLPQGRSLISPEGKVLVFHPSDEEYGPASLGGHYGMAIARMKHQQRWDFCLTVEHCLNLFPGIDCEEMLTFIRFVKDRYSSSFDPKLDILAADIAEQLESGLVVVL